MSPCPQPPDGDTYKYMSHNPQTKRPRSGGSGAGLLTSSPGGLAEMPRQMLVHLEHRAPIGTENLAKLVVGDDLALVLRVLQVVLADVVPDLADDLAARQRVRAG